MEAQGRETPQKEQDMELKTFVTLAEAFEDTARGFRTDAQTARWVIAALNIRQPDVVGRWRIECQALAIPHGEISLAEQEEDVPSAMLRRAWNVLVAVAEDEGLTVEQFLPVIR